MKVVTFLSRESHVVQRLVWLPDVFIFLKKNSPPFLHRYSWGYNNYRCIQKVLNHEKLANKVILEDLMIRRGMLLSLLIL